MSQTIRLDFDRVRRRGFGETVFCAGKTPEQTAEIFRSFREHGQEHVLGTRAGQAHADAVLACLPDAVYDPVSRLIRLGGMAEDQRIGGCAVCTGGTADVPVAEEAAQTAEFFGCRVKRIYDVGVAGLHRLLDQQEILQQVNVVIAAAGMEGALGSVVAGLVNVPVIALPTSVGYGASFEGIAPLLAMLNSCAEGMSVVNIDNGFGAGYLAAQINRLIVNGGNVR